MANARKSVALFGASGTIGRAAAGALVAQGHAVTCFLRDGSDWSGCDGLRIRRAEVVPFGGDLRGFDAVMSCLASRTGLPADAWAVDYAAHMTILKAAQAAGVAQFVLLSAICVQKPLLEFQKAKLAFEGALQASGLDYSIVRPTAFFKSLSGQIRRVQEGKPFLLFGDGLSTACKPISDRDLGQYLAACLTDGALRNRILPIGGPGEAMTARAQGELIFKLTGKPPKFRHVPLRLMDGIIGVLRLGGGINPALRDKAELARIGRYYATESMLVWDGAQYDARATPSFGADTLADHYRAVIAGDVAAGLGDHAVF